MTTNIKNKSLHGLKNVPSSGPQKKTYNLFRKVFGKKLPDLSFLEDDSLSKLEKDFLYAAHSLEEIKKHLEGDQWLVTYSLYKQATEGDCKAKKPSRLFKTRFLKHEYWCRRNGMPTDVAAKRYVETVKEYIGAVELKLKKIRVRKPKPLRQPRKLKKRDGNSQRQREKKTERKGSVIPLTAEDAPASYEEGIVYAKPIRKLNRARASVEINNFLSVRLSSTGAVFSEDNPYANFSTFDEGRASFIPPNKRSTIILQQPMRQSIRSTFIPSEAEFKRFTLVRNSAMYSVTSTMSFQKPSYYYHGPSLERLVEIGKKQYCPYQSQSAHLEKSNIDKGYHDILPVIHLLKVEFLKEIEKISKTEVDEQMAQIIANVPLDRFMFRLVRYLDRWFEEKPSLNSAGSRSLIISKIYLETKLKKHVDDLAVNEESIYKLLSVCMLLSAKYCEDCLIANSYWSEVSGMSVKELNRVEEMFLDASNFDLFITNEDLIKYGSMYHLAMGGGSPKPRVPNHKTSSITLAPII